MSDRAKLRTEQHMIDAEGQELLRTRLPKPWVLREYRPDYGLDYAVEAFRQSGLDARGKPQYETLGEHFYIQLKSCRSTTRGQLELFSRGNVEKAPEKLNRTNRVGELETIRFSIETPELVTVQRMGAAVPVLLVIADLDTQSCHFVCLNDYIDKLLIPRHDVYTSKKSRTIHVPVRNELGDTEIGQAALRWYAKRPKLYAAFMKFVYQHVELSYAQYAPEFEERARHFARLIVAYDFWNDLEMCKIVGHYGAAVRRYLETGHPGLMALLPDEDLLRTIGGSTHQLQELEDQFRQDELLLLWHGLSVLPRNYEEVWREWFLPTGLGFLSSY